MDGRSDYREAMAEQSELTVEPIQLRLSMDWRWHRPKRRGDLPRGEPRQDERPVKCVVGTNRTGCPPNCLPFSDRSVQMVDSGHILAHVRNDEGLASELSRIVKPGGTVSISVPATGPLAGLDAYNLHRYLVDVSGRGLRPYETAEVGWRRHFSLDDIRLLFPETEWEIISREWSGLAIEEMIRLAGFIGFRWLRPSRDRYRKTSALADRIESVERRLPIPGGFWLELELRRRES
jgi:SAM-dependent methyltransferase